MARNIFTLRISRLAVFGLAALLGACAGAGDGALRVPTNLDHVFVDDETGRFETYPSLLGDVSQIRPTVADLPLARVPVNRLTPSTTWLRAYDFDADGSIDVAELTLAWVVKSAVLKTGRTFPPTAVKTFLPATSPNQPLTLRSLRGIEISLDERQLVRGVIEGSGGIGILVSVDRVLADLPEDTGSAGRGGAFGATY